MPLCAGAYVLASDWAAANAADRHRLRVHGVLPAVAPRLVVSHRSALAFHGLPTLGEWPERVHVTDPESRRGRGRVRLVRHGGPLPSGDIETIDGVCVTSVARTIVDVARVDTFAEAVVAADGALRLPGVAAAELHAALDGQLDRQGVAAARRVVDFASAQSDSGGESWCRCRLFELGTPTPVLQKVLLLNGDRVGPVDFWFADQGVVVEFDGDVKYLDARYSNGLSASEIVLKERRLLAVPEVRDVVRVDWPDLVQPWRLRRLLVAAGVPVR